MGIATKSNLVFGHFYRFQLDFEELQIKQVLVFLSYLNLVKLILNGCYNFFNLSFLYWDTLGLLSLSPEREK